MRVSDEKFIAALEKNGYRRANGSYITFSKDGSVYSACAVGQALLNLGADPKKIASVGSYIFDFEKHTRPDHYLIPRGTITCPDSNHEYLVAYKYLYELAIHLNDDHKFSVQKNAKILREVLEGLNASAS